MANRNDIADIFRKVDPDGDYDNDDVFYGRILSDYEDYARLLSEEALRLDNPPDTPAPPPSDGLPHLGGADIGAGTSFTSLFDIASGA